MRSFSLDNRAVVCPNASTMGFSTYRCKRGDFVRYQEEGVSKFGRSLGRVVCAHDKLENCTGFVCVVVPCETFTSAYVRWVSPAAITYISQTPIRVPCYLFGLQASTDDQWRTLNNKNAAALARRIDAGHWSEPSDNMLRRVGL